MAQRILKNNTASPVDITDTGYTVPASGQLVIPPQKYGVFEGSSDVIVYIGDSTLTVNDGTFDLSISEGTRLIQGGFSRPISDGEDPTKKATVTQYGDIWRLRVENLNNTAGVLVPALTNTLRYKDMNAANGGVARQTKITDAAWTAIINISNSGGGLIHGFVVNIETKDYWLIRFVVDGVEVFGSSGILSDDLVEDDAWDLDNGDKDWDYGQLGLFYGEHDKLFWGMKSLPMRFLSSVQVYLRRVSGEGDKKFRAGLMVISLY